MKKVLFLLLALAVASPSFGEEARDPKKGRAARYAQRDATTLSMMGWGLTLAVGIGALFALLDNDAASSSSSSSGSSSHSHS